MGGPNVYTRIAQSSVRPGAWQAQLRFGDNDTLRSTAQQWGAKADAIERAQRWAKSLSIPYHKEYEGEEEEAQVSRGNGVLAIGEADRTATIRAPYDKPSVDRRSVTVEIPEKPKLGPAAVRVLRRHLGICRADEVNALDYEGKQVIQPHLNEAREELAVTWHNTLGEIRALYGRLEDILDQLDVPDPPDDGGDD